MDDWSAEELERFRELMERANRELEENNEVSKETRDGLKAFNEDLEKSSRSTGRALNNFGNALTSYADSIHKGERGAAVAARSLDSVAGSAAGVMENFGPLGKAASAVTKAFGRVVVAVGEQADAQFDALRGLQRFGAAANDGLEGIQNTLIGLNLTTDQLQEMVQMIGQQAPSLALFQTTLSDARVELSEVGRVLKGQGLVNDLMLLGMRAEDISEAFINFTAMQAEVGMSQQRDTLELANASSNYLKEINALTKATGIERDMLEEKIRSMREEERFRAFTATLRAEGRGDLALSAEIATAAMGDVFSEQVAKGFRDILAGGGAITSQEAQQLLISTGMGQEGIQQIAADFREGRMDEGELLQRVAESLGQTGEQLRRSGLPQVGALGASGSFVDYATLARAAVISENKNYVEALEQARRERLGELEQPEENVQTLVNLTQDQINASQNISDIIQNFMGLNQISATLTETFAALSGAGADLLGAGVTRGGAGDYGGEARTRGGNPIRSEPATPRETSRSGRNAPRMRNGVSVEATVPEISELVEQYSRFVDSDQSVTLSDLIQNSSIASDIANYLGVGVAEPLDLSPATVGKIVMGQAGLQSGERPSAGEQYRDIIRDQLRQEFGEVGEFRQGGIATGPRSGYLAELHGTEAIVPLNGGSIPVTISNLESKISGPIQQLAQRMDIAEDLIVDASKQQTATTQVVAENSESTRRMVEQTSVLKDQISRLDRLIQVSQTNNNIMSKILQNSYA